MSNTHPLHTTFSSTLLEWSAKHHRPMPWKGVKNPYWIWLSEIILQQTRVAQGLPYFEQFVRHYPTVQDLANAPEDEVMKLWQGLGYYSRARNLHFTAKHIANNLNGAFPNNFKDILKLKGVGPYTAAAIASFAFDLPHAVVDGNVFRILSRVFGIETPMDTTEGKHYFNELAQTLLDNARAADYNQAIMDFGATHCTPKLPKCSNCPFRDHCWAFNNNKVLELPVKSKKLQKKTRYFNYIIINANGATLLQKRTANDIWQNLYEFPLIETNAPFELPLLQQSKLWKNIQQQTSASTTLSIKKISPPQKQVLTHRKIIATFIEITLNQLPKIDNTLPVSLEMLHQYAFPKTISSYLERYFNNSNQQLDLF